MMIPLRDIINSQVIREIDCIILYLHGIIHVQLFDNGNVGVWAKANQIYKHGLSLHHNILNLIFNAKLQISFSKLLVHTWCITAIHYFCLQ